MTKQALYGMVEVMLLNRIKRGAVRVSLLAQHKLTHHRLHIHTSVWRPVRSVLLSALVLRTAIMPVPLVAPATAVAAGPEDAEPSPRVVRVSVLAQEAIQVNQNDPTILTVASSQLTDIAVGESRADEAAAAEAATKAAEIAKQAAAKKVAAKAIVVTPAPSTTWDRATVATIIREAAAKYGVDAELLLRIAQCESGLNPSAKNRNSSASGLFQFMPSTYRNSPSGAAGLSIWDPRANAEAAAFKIANGALRAWNASRHCWSR